MINLIFDYETTSQDPFRCGIVNCAYFLFDTDRFVSDNPYTFSELTASVKCDKLDLPAQKKAGYHFDKETINWWMKQDVNVRNQLLPSENDISRQSHTSNLKKYISNVKLTKWWSRGNTFDPVILTVLDAEADTAIFNILKFWNVRDVRTYVDSKFDFSTRTDFIPFEDVEAWNKVFEKHISVHDVSADVLRMQQIVRAENGLPLVNS